ncbi:hypothetical protein PZ938_03035 [Luteipulveratus sp. YIM 133132]|uniref:hypothetical protein n=1 Tax=Luteipulveratus flavus TaxID=3031728 RepID=UPI0023AEEB20|nr:hypothetical protein [Luteipulveratus sp. YIM 133132]MDE9364567.1 hypothetical protein [Luteipulveratus sp. YIM 133132]
MTHARSLSLVASPVAVDVARLAARRGVVPSELRPRAAAGPQVRAELVEASGSNLDATEWRQVAQLLSKHLEKAARTGLGSPGSCQACGQSVRWVETQNARHMPIDPLPHPRGNVTLRRQGQGVVAVVHGLQQLPLPDEAYRPHRATCPREVGTRPRPNHPTCRVCGEPMDTRRHDAGETTHPCCDPRPEAARP